MVLYPAGFIGVNPYLGYRRHVPRLTSREDGLRHEFTGRVRRISMLRKNFLITWALIAVVLASGMFVVGAATSFATSDRSSGYCDNYAKDYADRNANSGGDVLGSALGGAATGAILGGIIGGGRGAGTGAAIGGGVGALGGGAAAANDWSYLYNRSYNRCMSGGRL